MAKINIMKKIIIVIFSVLLLAFCVDKINVSAENEEYTEYSITVNLADENSDIILSGYDVYLFQIAVFNDYDSREYVLSDEIFSEILSEDDFVSADILCTEEHSLEIISLIEENQIAYDKAEMTSESGFAVFENLESGVYLLMIDGDEEYTASSFMIELPMYENGEFVSNPTAFPKIEISLTQNLPTPEETTQTEDESENIITTSESLPQTGQNNLPVPLLFCCGLTLIILGIADSKRRKN